MNDDVNIRAALYGDIPLIHGMAEVVFRRTYAEILSPEQMEYMMDWMYSEEHLREQMDSGHQYFLAFCGEVPAGYVSVQPEDAPEAGGRQVFHLQKLYVMPEFQGRGLGRTLFDRAVSSIAPCAPCRIELNVNRNNPAVKFYEHIGMRRLRQGDFPIGQGFYMNDYIMGLDVEG